MKVRVYEMHRRRNESTWRLSGLERDEPCGIMVDDLVDALAAGNISVRISPSSLHLAYFHTRVAAFEYPRVVHRLFSLFVSFSPVA